MDINELFNNKSIKGIEKVRQLTLAISNNEILIKDGRCVDCIQEQAFFEMTIEDNSEDEDEF